jgi:transposase
MTKQKKQKHTKEFKDEAVKLITVQGYSVAEAARNLCINATILGAGKKNLSILKREL